jgi:hypothetical protein
MEAEDLPPEVSELFERDGQWSQTRSSLFFFTCDCGHQAVCRCEQKEEEDVWFRNCAVKSCDYHGQHEVTYVDIDEDESKRRHKREKEIGEKGESLISEIEHFLGVAATVHTNDTDYSALLDRIVDDVIRRYVFIGREESIIMALWIVHTWCLKAAEFTPYIHLRSPLPREGKSRVLDVLGFLVPRAVRMSDPTPAAIADLVTVAELMESEPPTFLWDEIDSAYERWTALREYVNNGFQRGNVIIRAGGKVKLTFAPKVMAGLAELPLTVKDRSFRFDMTRAMAEEKPERLTPKERRYLSREANEIQMALGAFAELHMETLVQAEPELPEELDDRAQDIAEPLLAIADVIGGDWPVKSRSAMITIRNSMMRKSSVSDPELLLSDIRDIFGTLRTRIYTESLVDKLLKREESPWAGMRLTSHKLGRMLHEFAEYPGGPRITSQRMRIARGPQRRGYTRKQFEDAWSRYLSDK